MDIEQLKLVLEAVASVSENAQDVAIAWLVVDGIVPYCVTLVGFVLMYKVITRLIDKAQRLGL